MGRFVSEAANYNNVRIGDLIKVVLWQQDGGGKDDSYYDIVIGFDKNNKIITKETYPSNTTYELAEIPKNIAKKIDGLQIEYNNGRYTFKYDYDTGELTLRAEKGFSIFKNVYYVSQFQHIIAMYGLEIQHLL